MTRPLEKVAIAFYVAVTLLGFGRWALRRPGPTTTPEITVSASSDGRLPLSHYTHGATVRASSWDAFRRHHPLFAIDGEPSPTPLERWVPAPSDRAPWLEVRLATRVHVSEVRLVFSSGRVRSYAVRALSGGAEVAAVRIDDNERHDVRHTIDREAETIRVELARTPGSELVSLDEIEVWGRP